MATTRGITIERQILLYEIERHCSFTDCNARVFIGLTKPEAIDYRGFTCTNCERWNVDLLGGSDVPEWWDEINPIAKIAH